MSASSPEGHLLHLGDLFRSAWTLEAQAWAELDASGGDDTHPASIRARSLNGITGTIVEQIEPLAARTLAGLILKMDVVRWCRAGEPVGLEDLDAKGGGTDMQVLAGLIADLSAMGSAAA